MLNLISEVWASSLSNASTEPADLMSSGRAFHSDGAKAQVFNRVWGPTGEVLVQRPDRVFSTSSSSTFSFLSCSYGTFIGQWSIVISPKDTGISSQMSSRATVWKGLRCKCFCWISSLIHTLNIFSSITSLKRTVIFSSVPREKRNHLNSYTHICSLLAPRTVLFFGGVNV